MFKLYEDNAGGLHIEGNNIIASGFEMGDEYFVPVCLSWHDYGTESWTGIEFSEEAQEGWELVAEYEVHVALHVYEEKCGSAAREFLKM